MYNEYDKSDLTPYFDAVGVIADGNVYKLENLSDTPVVFPDDFTQLKGMLRTVIPYGSMPYVQKDPLDQYLYDTCGRIYDKLDGVIFDTAFYLQQNEINELRDLMNKDPYIFVNEDNYSDVSNFLAECLITGNISCIKMIVRKFFMLKSHRISKTQILGGVCTADGIWHSVNPNEHNMQALLNTCKKMAGEHDMFNRIKNTPYELLVLSRPEKADTEFEVPQIFNMVFEIDTDNEYVNRDAEAELDENQPIVLRRVFDGLAGEAPLQLYDYSGRLVGDLPANTCMWMTKALDEALLFVTKIKTVSLKLDKSTQRVLSFKADFRFFAVFPEETNAYLSYYLIKNFDYPDERPLFFTRRCGLPDASWLDPIVSKYKAYQEHPENLTLTPAMKEGWSRLAKLGIINEKPKRRIPQGRDVPIPIDLVQASTRENAIAHYSKMLKDPRLLRYKEDRGRALILRAEAYVAQGEAASAMNDYAEAEQLIVQKPKIDFVYLAQAYIGQAKILAVQGNHNLAANKFGKAAAVLEHERENGRKSVLKMLIPVYILGAEECDAVGRYDLAVDALECATRIIEEDYKESKMVCQETAQIYYNLALSALNLGERRKALKALIRTAEIYESLIIRREEIDYNAAIDVYRTRSQLLNVLGFVDLAIRDKKRAAQVSSIMQRRKMVNALNRADNLLEEAGIRKKIRPEEIPLPPRKLSEDGVPHNPQRQDTRGDFVFESEDIPTAPKREPVFNPNDDETLLDHEMERRFIAFDSDDFEDDF